eukprot:scaffold347_cov239-Pinguiococcus_pyrenoidosus.AAC.49
MSKWGVWDATDGGFGAFSPASNTSARFAALCAARASFSDWWDGGLRVSDRAAVDGTARSTMGSSFLVVLPVLFLEFLAT